MPLTARTFSKLAKGNAPPKYAAVVADADAALIFIFGLGQMMGEEAGAGPGAGVGGWSQALYQRRVGDARDLSEVIARLEQIVREDEVSRVILTGDPGVVAQLKREMPPELAATVETMRLDACAPDRRSEDAR
jgi:hypothetical protein